MSDNIFLVSRDVCKPGQYIFPVEFYVIPRLAVLSKNRQTSSSCQKSIKSDSIKWHLLPHTQHSVKTIWIIINHWERSNCSYIIFTHIAEKGGQPRFYTSTWYKYHTGMIRQMNKMTKRYKYSNVATVVHSFSTGMVRQMNKMTKRL